MAVLEEFSNKGYKPGSHSKMVVMQELNPLSDALWFLSDYLHPSQFEEASVGTNELTAMLYESAWRQLSEIELLVGGKWCQRVQ